MPVKIFPQKFRAGTNVSEATEEAEGAGHGVRLSPFWQHFAIMPNKKLLLKKSGMKWYKTGIQVAKQ